MAAKKTDAKGAALAEIETHAQGIRETLKVPRQNELFRSAVEAGYLAALADGTVDESERDILVRAIEMLSQGAVVEWETEAELEACASRATAQGADARAVAVGKTLSSLGHADMGLYIAALVARASKGIDKKEAEVLKAVGGAAGLSADAVKDIVKRASGPKS
jgi:tellurite resistance protein